jgi:hypothetical protein
LGLVSRPGLLVERVERMIALQVAGASALILWDANKSADEIGLSSFHARLAAYQNSAVRTNPAIAVDYEDLFRRTPPEWYDEAGNSIWDRVR